MAPIRRYLRISKYSVLECRIYLDNPVLAQTWLLNPRNPVLPRVIDAVQPLVLPKLREEKERSRKKSNKKKAIKDVVTNDDFEVSIFLTETSTRHSLLTKRKYFREKVPGKLQSNSSKLIDETNNEPFDVDDNVPILREDSDDYVNLEAIPTLDGTPTTKRSRRNKRQRGDAVAESDSELESDGNGYVPAIEINSDDEEIVRPPPSKRSRRGVATLGDDEDDDAEDPDDKKKMALEISYEGFAIYGLCLCLIVKRREPTLRPSGNARAASTGTTATRSGNDVRPSGHAVMENWIASTQVPAGADAAEDAGG